ncbi:MAG TPA: protein kinase, partial [Candidatus Deferrimicrobium sp.]|nr:protein kinase [Candidatus Deferrimicrobium sp.]
CEEKNNGNLWFGTLKGLFMMKNGTGAITPSSFNTAFPNMSITTIFADNDKNIWIGTTARGVFRYKPDDGTFANLFKENGLADDYVRTITADQEESIWIGTAYGGLCRLRDGKFKTYGTHEGLIDEVAFAIFEDSRHYLWIGTDNGLTRLKDGGGPVNFDTRNGLSNASVNTIYEDRSGSIWVCTVNGLNRLQNTPAQTVKIKQYIPEDFVLSVAEDSSGNLWAGTTKELLKKEKNSTGWQKIYFEISGGEKQYFKHVNLIYEDKNKNMWFSVHVYPRGLVKWDGRAFTLYNDKKGLSSSLQCIYEDKDGVFWLGSANGLFRFKDETFTHLTMKDGLFNNNIYQILEDNQGNFWFSCNKGFFTVSKKELNDYANTKTGAILCKAYNKDDGMRSPECNGGFQSAGCKTGDGNLWFPTNKGAVTINPGKIAINKLPPPVLIEQVLLDGVPTVRGEEIKIKPGVKRIEFRYAGLSFRVPQRVRFKYRLEGYNNDWMDAGNTRVATYTNLDAGTYRFQVQACNDDGIWNEQGAAVDFDVIPPFTETWLFRILALTAFALFSYLFINFINKYLNLVNFWNRQKYVGKFKLLDKIGSGGMGTVYKAENTMERNEKVAIKVLREELFDDEKNRKRFKQEAAIIDQLDHPNIIKIYERGQSHHSMYIAMELLEGKTLTRKIEEEGKLDLFDSLHIMTQVTEAVAKIHSKSIIHRDMKPDNVMLIQKNNDPHFVKLLDFGLAKMEHQTRLTQTGMVIGTINYMAPEQIAGTEVTGATDIYSIGVMFYEMVTGKKPFTGETTIDIMKEIIEKIPVEPVKFRADIPPALSDLILQMMAKKRIERPATGEVLKNLQILSEGSAGKMVVNPKPI